MASNTGIGRLTTTGDKDASNSISLVTGGANGTKITRIRAFHETSGNFVLRLFIDVGGTSRIWGVYLAANLTAQVGQFARPATYGSGTEILLEMNSAPLQLPSGAVLKANLITLPGVGQFVDVTAEGLDN